jgi:hypothetical protein
MCLNETSNKVHIDKELADAFILRMVVSKLIYHGRFGLKHAIRRIKDDEEGLVLNNLTSILFVLIPTLYTWPAR